MANPMLLWFVGYSNMTSIAIVTVCFLAMTIFIGLISMNGDYRGRSNIHIGIEQRNMVKMSNPFFLQLEQHSKKLADGLHLRLSSLLPSEIFVLWGAKINPFHDLILKPGRGIQQAFASNKVEDYNELDILHCDKMKFTEAGDHSISLPCPVSVSRETLGDMPRKRYPVAVFTFVPDDSSRSVNATGRGEGGLGSNEAMRESESENENRHSIIGLISIIHLQDDKVTQSSHIIGQYVKTSGVPLYSLQPLYLSSDSCHSQQNHPGRGNVEFQHQSSNKENRTESAAMKLIVSSNENLKEQSSSSDAHSESKFIGSGKTQESCLSCGRTPVDKSESLLRKRDSRRPENMMADVCDKCCSDCKTAKNDEHGIRHLEEKSECPENDVKMMSDSSCDVKDKNNFKEESHHQISSQAECVVCQTHRVKCALLPCRHACVCLGCFKLLFRCPMCRAGIESYFLLRSSLNSVDGITDDEDDEQSEGVEEDVLQNLQHQAVNASFHEMWERLNARLNNILGFR